MLLNVFVNSTTFGQAMGATFDLSVAGDLSNKRITALEDCAVLEPIYEKQIATEKIAEYLKTGQTQKVSNLGKAIETENIRVNSLAVLIRELALVLSLETEEPVTVYVPYALLQEIQSGRIRYYLAENTNSYYSQQEIELWKEALPLMHEMFYRLVFKSIDTCKSNSNNDPVQALRVSISNSMYARLLKSYKEFKAIKAGTQATVNFGDAF